MKLYKNLMVVFRGHVRTWDYVREPTLAFYDSLADNVDYYISTWNLENFNYLHIEKCFEGRNLIKLLTINQSVEFSAWMGPGYQGYRILPYKRLREREIGKYDAVIDTRFDVMAGQGFIKYTDKHGITITDIPITKIKPNTLYTDRINFEIEQEPGVRLPRLADHWFIMSSDMYQYFTERFIRKEKYSCHEEFYFMCKDENWDYEEALWAKTMIVRPNMIYGIRDPSDFFEIEKKNDTIKGLYEYESDWINMSVRDRAWCCHSLGISLGDYDFQNSLISAYVEGERKP